MQLLLFVFMILRAMGQEDKRERSASLIILPPLVLGYDDLYDDEAADKRIEKLQQMINKQDHKFNNDQHSDKRDNSRHDINGNLRDNSRHDINGDLRDNSRHDTNGDKQHKHKHHHHGIISDRIIPVVEKNYDLPIPRVRHHRINHYRFKKENKRVSDFSTDFTDFSSEINANKANIIKDNAKIKENNPHLKETKDGQLMSFVGSFVLPHTANCNHNHEKQDSDFFNN